ncbi:MAG: protein phosphatase 2C domain-containing protein [Planctomycetota bacterium]
MPKHDLRLFLECNMEEAELIEFAGGRIGVFSRAAPIEGRANEDGAGLVFAGENAAVLAVADGLGGSRGGASASRTALETLGATFASRAAGPGDLRATVLEAFDRANEAVRALGTGAATTLAVALIEDGSVRPFHVGDSEILVLGQRGKVKLHTVSHSPTGYAVEAGLLSEREALHHEDRHIISNCVGSADMHVALGPEIKLSQYDTVVLASDGLFDNLHLKEIVDYGRKGALVDVLGTLSKAVERRMNQSDAVNQPSKVDDLTYLLYRPSGR